jgi:hypothetical protein
MYGKEWEKIEAHIGTRDAVACRSHSQKFFRKLVNYLKGGRNKKEIKDAQRYFKILDEKYSKRKK